MAPIIKSSKPSPLTSPVSAYQADLSDKTEAGKSYVIFGKQDNAAINLSAIAAGTGGFVIKGESVGDYSGYSVSSAGDVNGDGLDDLIIGAIFADASGVSNAGKSYVVFGKQDNTTINLSAIVAGLFAKYNIRFSCFCLVTQIGLISTYNQII
jgi:hypothetical protein